MSAIFFCLIYVYLIFKITSKGHNIQLPGYIVTSMFIYSMNFFSLKYYKPFFYVRYLWLDQQDVERASASKRLDFLRESGVKLLLSRHCLPRLSSRRSSWDTSTPRMGNETHIHVLLYHAFLFAQKIFFLLLFLL